MSQSSFFRIEGYGLQARHQAGKKAAQWRTIEGVAAEAARNVGAAAHVKGNVAVELLLGEDPMDLAKVAIEQARRAKNQGIAKPGRLSPTASSFFGAVASFPESSRQRADDPGFIERYNAWRERLLAWVQLRWGCFPISVVEHRDEEFWHTHILIVPPLDEQGRLLAGAVHPGYAARGDLERAGHASGPANAAYKDAMRALLDEFQAEVGAPSGHTRKSDQPRRRVTRAQVMIDRRQHKREFELHEREHDLIIANNRLQHREASLGARIGALDESARSLAAEHETIERQRRQLEEEAQAFAAASAAEREALKAAWTGGRARLNEAAGMVRQASAENSAEHERLVEAKRLAMATDPVRLAAENAQMRSAFAEAQRIIADLAAERGEPDVNIAAKSAA